jgi:hypothetical protein
MKLRGNFYYHHKNTNQNLGRAKIFAMLRLTVSYLFFLAPTDKTGANPFRLKIQKTTAMPYHWPASAHIIESLFKMVVFSVEVSHALTLPMAASVRHQQA